MKTFLRLIGVAVGLYFAPHIHAADTTGKTKAPAAETKAKSSAKVDINTADAETLQTLPGVGPATARAIIAARPFKSVDDLENVTGIGSAKLADLRPLVRVSRVASAGSAKDSEPAKRPSAAGKASTRSETSRRDSTAASTSKSRAMTKVDVNTADAATLEELPGVGPATARAIIAGRPFASVDELENVAGIGPARLAELRDHVTVSRASKKVATAPVPSSSSRNADTTRPRNAEPVLTPTGRDSPREPAGARGAAAGKINLNTATLEQLESLPEIGPVKAQAIIEARPFSSVEDVMRVKGIKEGTYDVIKDRITVR